MEAFLIQITTVGCKPEQLGVKRIQIIISEAETVKEMVVSSAHKSIYCVEQRAKPKIPFDSHAKYIIHRNFI